MNLKKKLPMIALIALLGVGVSASLTSCEEKDSRTEVVFWHTMGKNNQEKLQVMIDQFEEANPNIKITHSAQGGYTDIEDKILKAIPAKTTPTMAFCYPDHVARYINSGSSVKLNDLVNDPEIGLTAEELKDYKDAGFWGEGAAYDNQGSIYSVPFSKSTEVLFINTSWLKSNGFVDENGDAIIPTKWESEDPNDLTAMFNLCRAIKAKDSSVTPLGYDSDDNMYITLSAQYGIPYTANVAEGENPLLFDNEQAKDLVTRLKGYYDEGLFVTKGTLPNNTYTSTKFVKEELIMSIGSTGGTSYNVPSKDSDGNYLFNVEVAPLPQANANAPKVISQGPSITFFKNTKISEEQVRASWQFYKFITNTYNSAAYAIFTGYEPVRNSSYESDEYVAHLGKLGTADETLYTKVANITATTAVKDAYFYSPVFVGSSVARQQCGGIITQVLLGNKTVTKAFEDAMNETVFALD